MRVKRLPKSDAFEPITLQFTLENESEARAMYAIFNCAPNAAVLPDTVAEQVKDAIGRRHYISGGVAMTPNQARQVAREKAKSISLGACNCYCFGGINYTCETHDAITTALMDAAAMEEALTNQS